MLQSNKVQFSIDTLCILEWKRGTALSDFLVAQIILQRVIFYLLPNTYLRTYLLTPCSSHSWEANWFSDSQWTPLILWNPKVHSRIHKCPPPVPILRQHDAVRTPTPYLLKIHFIITLPSTPGSPKWSLSLMFRHLNPVYASPLSHIYYWIMKWNVIVTISQACQHNS